MIICNSHERLTTTKRCTTMCINKIIADCKAFKIGKTGDPQSRAANYGDFDKMYLLVQSKNSLLIDRLEGYYTQKYYGHKKNMNINRGSAAVMASSHRTYYLYIVVK